MMLYICLKKISQNVKELQKGHKIFYTNASVTATVLHIFRTVELYFEFFLFKPRGQIFHLNHLTANHLQDILSFICPGDGITDHSYTCGRQFNKHI